MVLRVDILIYIYMILCFCMLIFNITYTVRTRYADQVREKRIEKYADLLGKVLGGQSDSPQIVYLRRKLKRAGRLEIFYEASRKVCGSEGGKHKFELWLDSNQDLFLEIGESYMRKNVLQKAFYAYVIWQYGLCRGEKKNISVRRMLQMVLEPSMYCRENALCALYSGSDEQAVVKAYVLLSRRGIRHSSKLVTDGLLMFRGGRDELAEALWESWSLFTDYYKTAFINFMRIASGNFRRRLIPVLADREEERELRFAVIRYYRKYYYEDAEPYLQEMAANWQEDDWEFAALSALALENYPGSRSICSLRFAVKSRTWYVRENAAESLIKLAGKEQVKIFLEEETDQYAKDMLKYKLESRKEAG